MSKNYIVCKPFQNGLNAQKAVREYYNAGKDFIILSVVHGTGRHISKAECDKDASICLEVRYGRNLEKIMLLPDHLC